MNEQLKIRQNGRNASNAKQRSPLLDLCDCVPDAALNQLDAQPSGLTPEQVEERHEKFGPNEVTQEKPPALYMQLFHAFLTPFNGVLFAVSIVSLFSDVIFAARPRTAPSGPSSFWSRWCCSARCYGFGRNFAPTKRPKN